MAIRLIECHRVLKDTGSIYLHCDPTMSHYLKITLDCIFGEKNFGNEIIWHYQSGGRQKHLFSRKHDIIFLYIKSAAWKFNADAVGELRGSAKRNNMKKEKDKDGRVYWSIKSGGKLYKYYEDDKMTPADVWTDISHIQQRDPQRLGYPTQKPLKLLERIIQASSNKSDVVLDPFCGCATTCIAAENLERQWIGIDISYKAFELVKQRLKKETPENLFLGEPNFNTAVPVRTQDDEEEQGGFIYIIANKSWRGLYKVGITKDVKRRLNSYQTSDPHRGYTLAYKKQTMHCQEIEKRVHKQFGSDYEWVNADKNAIVKAIEDTHAELSKKINAGGVSPVPPANVTPP